MVVKIEQAKKPTKKQTIDWEPLLAGVSNGRSRIEYGANRNIFSQGESADSLFYLREGKVKLAVTSKQGKEAIVAIMGEGDFFGEGCLAGQRLRMATALSPIIPKRRNLNECRYRWSVSSNPSSALSLLSDRAGRLR